MKPSLATAGEENASPRPALPATTWDRTDAVVLAALMLLCVGVLVPILHIGWVPSDEGTLAASAARVLRGQLPHRDFAEIYTGGLSFLHAAAFRLFGVNLFSLRLCVFLFFLAWLPAVYAIARRFLTPVWAGAITLLAVVWSYPNYVASMPSWYNLFFATFGVAALLHYLDQRRARWLVLAGICGGLSLDIKITGLYYIAAVLLFLLHLEQQDAETLTRSVLPRSAWFFRLASTTSLLVFLFLLTHAVWIQRSFAEFLNFLLPSYTCVVFLIWSQRTPAWQGSAARFLGYAKLLGPFLVGVAIPLACLLLPYIASHSVAALLHGIFGSAASRMTGLAGRYLPPGITELLEYGLPMMGLFLAATFLRSRRLIRILTLVVALGFAAVLLLFAFPVALHDTLHDLWIMAGILTPLVVIFALVVASKTGERLLRSRIVLLAMVAGLCSLIQFPFPWVTYFAYTAPLTLLALLAALSFRSNRVGRSLLVVLFFFYLGLGLLGMVAEHDYNPDLHFDRLYPLELPRAGRLRIDSTTPGYEQLIPFLQAHSANGLMFCGNDCPQLYFLTGLQNPLPDDTGARPADILAAVRTGQLRLVVLNNATFFSSSSSPTELHRSLLELLPNTTTIANFTIFWR